MYEHRVCNTFTIYIHTQSHRCDVYMPVSCQRVHTMQ